MIDKNKWYKTTGFDLRPYPVTVFATDCRGLYPVVGVVHQRGCDFVASWTPDGRNNYAIDSHLDLIEITKAEWDSMMEELK